VAGRARHTLRGGAAVLAALLAGCAPARGTSAPAPTRSATRAVYTAPLDPDSVMAAADELSRRMYARPGNLLTRVQFLRAVWDEWAARPPHRQAVSLEMVRLAAELGDYPEALRHADFLYGSELIPPPSAPVPPLDGYRPRGAVDFLAAAAGSARVVMVNEAHHDPRHRAFTRALLVALRARGFRYFAAETLSHADTALQSRGYPVPRSGAYLGEPVFGDLVRTALQLGYTVVPYEARDPRTGREQAQAQNLAGIFARDPHARIVVQAGWDHVNESGQLSGSAPMAAQFRQLTGIDPLTVDQTVMTERASREYEHPLYDRVLARERITRPTVFVAPDGSPWTLEPGKRDVTVFHPRAVYRRGRPTWLEMDGVRTRVPLPPGICGTATRCLVHARIESEAPNAIPMDQVEVVRGAAVPDLLLRPGAYRVEVEDAAGTPITSFHRQVGRR
jgi:hypothetical protein